MNGGVTRARRASDAGEATGDPQVAGTGESMRRLQRLHIGAIAVTLGCLLCAPAGALATSPHPAAARVHRPPLEVVGPPSADATTSGNWFGYGQSATQHGVTLFRSITG